MTTLVKIRRAALAAMARAGVPFLRPLWQVPLQRWERPFDDPRRTLPQHPEVRAQQREACRRWREKKRARAPAAAAVRDDAQSTASEAASGRDRYDARGFTFHV
jgi:hypothetical protein